MDSSLPALIRGRKREIFLKKILSKLRERQEKANRCF